MQKYSFILNLTKNAEFSTDNFLPQIFTGYFLSIQL